MAIDVAVFAESGTYSGSARVLLGYRLDAHLLRWACASSVKPAGFAREIVARDRDLVIVHAVADDAESTLGGAAAARRGSGAAGALARATLTREDSQRRNDGD